MKGFLHKTEQGWVVRYDERTWQDPSAEDGELPLHPEQLIPQYLAYRILDFGNAQVEFEIVEGCCTPEGQIKRYVDCKGCDKKQSYAKLIPSKEQQKQLITEIMDLDAKDGLYEDDVERFSFKHELQNLINEHSMENGSDTPDFILASFLYSCLESFNHAVRQREQFYNKAKANLYTEEQVRQAIDMATTSKYDYKLEFYNSDEIIQSLKQSKKD